jgi:hypothetical protein
MRTEKREAIFKASAVERTPSATSGYIIRSVLRDGFARLIPIIAAMMERLVGQLFSAMNR